MRRFIWFVALLFLVACGGDGNTVVDGVVDGVTPAGADVSQGRPTPTTELATADSAVVVDDVATPTEDIMPTDVPSTDVPSTDVPPTDIPPTDVPPTDVPPTDVPPTDVPPSAVEPPAGTIVNGQNENGTFYRGWDTAPVTMIDYSDFL